MITMFSDPSVQYIAETLVRGSQPEVSSEERNKIRQYIYTFDDPISIVIAHTKDTHLSLVFRTFLLYGILEPWPADHISLLPGSRNPMRRVWLLENQHELDPQELSWSFRVFIQALAQAWSTQLQQKVNNYRLGSIAHSYYEKILKKY